jgi:hypothetical protein
MGHGLPVVAFQDATGAADVLVRGCGLLVPQFDVTAMADAVLALIADPGLRAAMGSTGRRIVADDYQWLDYVYFLLRLAGHEIRPVSVIVPNYNYAQFLEQRLGSIFGQTHPIREVIVLDDASTDSSITALDHLRHANQWDFTTVTSHTNSGSVFRQWLEGAKLARGELLWIAEADDFAEPDFLTRLVPLFANPRLVMAYSESRQVDEAGNVMSDNYLNYVSDIDAEKWTHSWVRPGLDEVAESFAIRNTVPSASAAIFDRHAILTVLESHLDDISNLRVAGDYATYANLLSRGGHIAFVADALNNHRRHERTVTTGSYGPTIVAEIARVQLLVRDLVPVRPEIRVRACQYLHELCTQFDISDEMRRLITTDLSP